MGGYGISIHKALASLDVTLELKSEVTGDFNPQGSREPRLIHASADDCLKLFQSTRLSRASTPLCIVGQKYLYISIHKALASLDLCLFYLPVITSISIHKALASLDGLGYPCSLPRSHFNPQGSREPRRSGGLILEDGNGFQSTRLSRASTIKSLS